MSLNVSHGNMYDWVTHMHSHLAGECLHKCSYCYVQKNRFGVSPRYQGNPRLIIDELKVAYGESKIIFIEHMNDMFAKGIKKEWIKSIFAHCNKYSNNQYVFQTKNPERAWEFREEFPLKSLIGTTIETNRNIPNSQAPAPVWRYKGIARFSKIGYPIFITIEPIMNFDDELINWIKEIFPRFVNIGADSKNCMLNEPPKEKVRELIWQLNKAGIPIKKKYNLERLIK